MVLGGPTHWGIIVPLAGSGEQQPLQHFWQGQEKGSPLSLLTPWPWDRSTRHWAEDSWKVSSPAPHSPRWNGGCGVLESGMFSQEGYLSLVPLLEEQAIPGCLLGLSSRGLRSCVPGMQHLMRKLEAPALGPQAARCPHCPVTVYWFLVFCPGF